MKVLVTGAAGFIGSHTAEALVKRGNAVVGMDNFNKFNEPYDLYDLERKRRNESILANQGVTIIEEDIRSENAKNIIVKECPNVIVHLAAMAGVRKSLELPKLYTDVNLTGTQNVIDAAKKIGSALVFGSSSSVYGDRKEVPFREDDVVNRPVSPYAATKIGGELLCRAHQSCTGQPTTCLRFFTVYGPRGRPDMAPLGFMMKIMNGRTIEQYGDGSSARDYTYIDDAVQGVLGAIDRMSGFRVYNLGNSSHVELNALIAMQEDICQKKPIIKRLPMPQGDVSITCADITKAQRELGYDPEVSLREGLERQYEWFVRQ